MSWSVDYIVRYNKDGHRFVILNDDCSGNSLLLDMNDKDKFCLELCFGNFPEPDWTYINPEDFTDEEKKFIAAVSENPSWSKWDNGDIKDWYELTFDEQHRISEK